MPDTLRGPFESETQFQQFRLATEEEMADLGLPVRVERLVDAEGRIFARIVPLGAAPPVVAPPVVVPPIVVSPPVVVPPPVEPRVNPDLPPTPPVPGLDGPDPPPAGPPDPADHRALYRRGGAGGAAPGRLAVLAEQQPGQHPEGRFRAQRRGDRR
jgi:hypothetical protein